jgi:thiol-disulfide isomerase/thioredoxin
MTGFTRKLEAGANVAIIVVAVLLGVVLVKNFLLAPSTLRAAEISAGTKVSLPGVDWGANRKTLVMVLQKGCHFCAESAPFYQRLARETSGQTGLRLLAVLPQRTDEAKEYLGSLSVPVQDVMQATPDSLGVGGTPTLILVDDHGAVIKSWVGKLPADQEAEVLKTVRS